MKYSVISNALKAAAVAVTLTVLPVSAQTTDPAAPGTTVDPAPGTTSDGTTTVTTEADNDGFDWGWLGLIGLAGLAGLAGRREEPARYSEPDVTRTTNRY